MKYKVHYEVDTIKTLARMPRNTAKRIRQKINHLAAAKEDLLLYQQAKAKKNPEFVPSEVVDRIIDDENLVRVWREYRGLSQQQLAEMGNISQTELSKIELGEHTGTTEILARLAKALDLSLDDLMTNHSEF